ncbi:MAG TPA: RNA polymerase sigma factor [Acidobacteriaceae bacterium]|nr:RNA polymerase sigma factor [Acidobacteriaceae bacterium]
MELLEQVRVEAWSDEQVVLHVLAGDTALYEILMRRYNQRLYRTVRAILREDDETEDVMQDAWVRAYQHLDQFEGRAAFSTWLTRIAVHEALARLRRRNRFSAIDENDGEMDPPSAERDPEQNTAHSEVSGMLEEALLNLPEMYRTVVMLRDVEELSTAETAASLEISEQNVKVRLHRGRALARKALMEKVGASAKTAFPFMGERCDRIVAGVFARLADQQRPR